MAKRTPKKTTRTKRKSQGERRSIGRSILPVVLPDEDLALPDRVPLLPLCADVVFPQTVVPLVVNRNNGIRLIDEVLHGDKTLGLITQRDPDVDDPGAEDLYSTVCVGSVLKMLKFPDGSTRIVCQGHARARLVEIVQTEPYLIGRIEPLEEIAEEGVELDVQTHHVRRLFEKMVDQSQQVPEELQVAAMNTHEPGRFADLLGSSLPFAIEEKQELLDEIVVQARLARLGQFLTRQLHVMELSSKIQAQVGSEITKAQREHFLRQQLKAIQEELGEGETDNPEIAELEQRLEKAKPPEHVRVERVANSIGSRVCTPVRPNTRSFAHISIGFAPSLG